MGERSLYSCGDFQSGFGGEKIGLFSEIHGSRLSTSSRGLAQIYAAARSTFFGAPLNGVNLTNVRDYVLRAQNTYFLTKVVSEWYGVYAKSKFCNFNKLLSLCIVPLH